MGSFQPKLSTAIRPAVEVRIDARIVAPTMKAHAQTPCAAAKRAGTPATCGCGSSAGPRGTSPAGHDGFSRMPASQMHETVDAMSLTASARSVKGTLRHEIEVNGRHTIFTDEPARLEGTDTAPTPHELLAAMLASCASTMVAMYARRHGWPLQGMYVEVDYDSDATPRHATVRLHLPAGLTREQVTRLRRVADTCPARRALEAGFEFDEELVGG